MRINLPRWQLVVGPRGWLGTLGLKQNWDSYKRYQWRIFCNGWMLDEAMPHESGFLINRLLFKLRV